MSYTRRKGKGDVWYFTRNGKRKKPIATSTVATQDWLIFLHEQHPKRTIQELRDYITDKRRAIHNPEALAVLDAYIKVGEGDVVPHWR